MSFAQPHPTGDMIQKKRDVIKETRTDKRKNMMEITRKIQKLKEDYNIGIITNHWDKNLFNKDGSLKENFRKPENKNKAKFLCELGLTNKKDWNDFYNKYSHVLNETTKISSSTFKNPIELDHEPYEIEDAMKPTAPKF